MLNLTSTYLVTLTQGVHSSWTFACSVITVPANCCLQAARTHKNTRCNLLSILYNVNRVGCVTDRFVFCLFVCVSGGCFKKRWRQRCWDGGSRRMKEPQFSLFITFTMCLSVGVCVSASVYVCVCGVRVRKRASIENRYECMCALWTVPKISGYHLQILFTFYKVPITHISLSQYKQRTLLLVHIVFCVCN